jgi:hypothetical protein
MMKLIQKRVREKNKKKYLNFQTYLLQNEPQNNYETILYFEASNWKKKAVCKISIHYEKLHMRTSGSSIKK